MKTKNLITPPNFSFLFILFALFALPSIPSPAYADVANNLNATVAINCADHYCKCSAQGTVTGLNTDVYEVGQVDLYWNQKFEGTSQAGIVLGGPTIYYIYTTVSTDYFYQGGTYAMHTVAHILRKSDHSEAFTLTSNVRNFSP